MVLQKGQQGDNYCFNYGLKQLRAKNHSTGPRKHIKASTLKLSLPWPLLQEVAASSRALFFVGGLVDGLSTVSIDSLYSTLKAVTRALETKHKKAVLKEINNSANKIIY